MGMPKRQDDGPQEYPLSYVQPDMLAYIAGPYTAKLPNGEEDHDRVAERMRIWSLCVGKLTDLGIKGCSPLMMHLIRQYRPDMPGDWNFWGTYSKVMLKQCHVMIVLKIEGWDVSTGVQAEIELALDNGIPIVYLDPSELLSKTTLENHPAKIKEAGTILVTVSHIESPVKRRLAIAGTFVPLLVGNIALVGIGATAALLKNTKVVFTTAKKFW